MSVRYLSVLSVVLALAPSANAQTRTFKCVLQGRTVYQQTACPVSASEGSSQATAKAASASSSPEAHSVRRHNAKHAASAATAASDAQTKADRGVTQTKTPN